VGKDTEIRKTGLMRFKFWSWNLHFKGFSGPGKNLGAAMPLLQNLSRVSLVLERKL